MRWLYDPTWSNTDRVVRGAARLIVTQALTLPADLKPLKLPWTVALVRAFVR